MCRSDLNHGQHERLIFYWEDKKDYFVTCVTAHSLNFVGPELRTNTQVQESQLIPPFNLRHLGHYSVFINNKYLLFFRLYLTDELRWILGISLCTPPLLVVDFDYSGCFVTYLFDMVSSLGFRTVIGAQTWGSWPDSARGIVLFGENCVCVILVIDFLNTSECTIHSLSI